MTGEAFPLARVDEFPTGVCRTFTVRNREVGVVRLADGAFRAVWNRCPHRGAPICRGAVTGMWRPSEPGTLLYSDERVVLTCPWHGREYDLTTGTELYPRQPGRLRLLPIEIDNGIVTLFL